MEQENLSSGTRCAAEAGWGFKGDPRAAMSAGARVPMPGTGADRPVVVLKGVSRTLKEELM